MPSPVEPQADDILTVGDVAALWKVTAQTVRNWADAGLVPSFRTPTNQRRFRRGDVQAARDRFPDEASA